MGGEATARDILREPPPGAHLILWSVDARSGDRAMAAFLLGATERGDLCVVVLPRKGLADLRDALPSHGLDLDALEAEGRALTVTPDRLGLRERQDVDRIPGILTDLRRLASLCGHRGVSVLGRLAAPFFEGGKAEVAESIEACVRDHAGDVRILCTYPARAGKFHAEEADTVVRFHTYAITALGGDRFSVEPVTGSASA